MPPPRGGGGGGGGAALQRRPPAVATEQQKQQPQQQQAAKAPQDFVVHNHIHTKNNAGVAYYLRIYMTIVAGAAAGVAGVEGWPGLALYLASQAGCGALLWLKSGGDVRRYFGSRQAALVEHVFSSTAILSYVLLWMVFFNLCHVF